MLACILHLDGRASAQLGALAKDFIVRVLCYKTLQLRCNTVYIFYRTLQGNLCVNSELVRIALRQAHLGRSG